LSSGRAIVSYDRIGVLPIPERSARVHRIGSEPLMEMAMGKYVLAWLLGVPAIVLVVIYLFFH
jgi:hypothetical protein